MSKHSFKLTNGNFLFWISVLLYLLFPVLLVERMVLDTDAMTTKIFPIYRFISLMACSFVLLAIFLVSKLRMNVLSLFMGILLMQGFVKGAWSDPSENYFLIHISAGLSMFAFYLAGTRCYLTVENTNSFFKAITYIFLVEYFVLILIAYLEYQYSGLLSLENFHLSLNIAPLLISFVYFLVHGKFLPNVLVLFLLFLSGKRSLLVTAVVLYLFYLFLAQPKRVLWKKWSLLLGAFSVTSGIGLMYSEKFTFLTLALSRLSSLNLLDGSGRDIDIDIDNISSGRWNEFIVVWDSITGTVPDFLYGAGFGNFIPISYESTFDHQIYYLEKIGFDVLPVHFMYQFGLPGSILLMGFIGLKLLEKFRYVRSENRNESNASIRARLIHFLSVLSMFINGFFTYINPDPFLWFCFGLLSSKKWCCVVNSDTNKSISSEHSRQDMPEGASIGLINRH